jgi:hypothetical protein
LIDGSIVYTLAAEYKACILQAKHSFFCDLLSSQMEGAIDQDSDEDEVDRMNNPHSEIQIANVSGAGTWSSNEMMTADAEEDTEFRSHMPIAPCTTNCSFGSVHQSSSSFLYLENSFENHLSQKAYKDSLPNGTDRKTNSLNEVSYVEAQISRTFAPQNMQSLNLSRPCAKGGAAPQSAMSVTQPITNYLPDCRNVPRDPPQTPVNQLEDQTL